MARIGDYIDPSLNRYDPSPYLQAQGNATRTIGAGVANAVGDFGDVLKEQREKKNEVKANSKLIESYMTLFPDSAPALGKIKDALADEDTPVSERHAIAKQTGDLINAYLIDKDRAAQHGIQQQQIALQERGTILDEQRQGADMDAISRALAEKDTAKRDQDQLASAAGPLLLGSVLDQAKGRGVSIDPAVLEGLSPANKGAMAELLAKILPEDAKPILQEVEFERDGKPYRGTAQLTKDGFQLVPVQEAPASAPAANSFKAQTTNYSLGKDAGGPDEMQDYWTNRGYSSTGKNLAPGVVAVNPKVFKHGTVFQDADSGEVFIAADSHGNADPKVIDIYQPPGEYKKDKRARNMRVIGFEENVGKSPEEIANQRAYWSKLAGQPGISAGAVRGWATPQTPAQAKLDELKVKEMEGQITAQSAALDKQTDMKGAAKASAEGALGLIQKLRDHPGFENAVGTTYVPGFLPATDRKGAEAIIEQLKGQAFLNAIQQLRGLGALSDAEGAKLQQAAARLDTKQSEKDFKVALSDYESIIKDAIGRLGGSASGQTPQSKAKSELDKYPR